MLEEVEKKHLRCWILFEYKIKSFNLIILEIDYANYLLY